jgi:hypothetical protein
VNHLTSIESKMTLYQSKAVGRYILTIGVLIAVSAVFLIIFFIGYWLEIPALTPFGPANDVLNATVSILGAVLAIILLPSPREKPLLFWIALPVVAAVWVGAAMVTLDSMRMGGMISNTAVAKLRINYGLGFITDSNIHIGDGLAGFWLVLVNLFARLNDLWPRQLTLFGMAAGGLLVLNFFGMTNPGLLYMVWCIWLGKWLIQRENLVDHPEDDRRK